MSNQIATSGGASEFDISDYTTNPELEAGGVWRSLGKDGQGRVRRIKLARLNNDDYTSLLRKKQRANQALLEQNDDEAFALAKKIQREVLAQTVIKGLEVDGKEIRYTPEVGIQLMQSDDFMKRVTDLASQADAYRDQQDEVTVKS